VVETKVRRGRSTTDLNSDLFDLNRWIYRVGEIVDALAGRIGRQWMGGGSDTRICVHPLIFLVELTLWHCRRIARTPRVISDMLPDDLLGNWGEGNEV